MPKPHSQSKIKAKIRRKVMSPKFRNGIVPAARLSTPALLSAGIANQSSEANASAGDNAMIKALIDAGAAPALKDDRGDSPLTWYSRHQRDVPQITLVRCKISPLLEYD